VPTARILIPAEYLDAHRADPHPDMPAALLALLADADTIGPASNRRAVVHVPAEHLPALDAIALAQFTEWGDTYTRHRRNMPADEAEALRRLSRAAYQVHHQARYAANR
jgi:hypothetical protein